MSAAMEFFCYGLRNEFEIAVVNEPSVFDPLKFYCILNSMIVWNDFFQFLFYFAE